MDPCLGLEDGEIPNSAPYENFDWYLSFLECDNKFQATWTTSKMFFSVFDLILPVVMAVTIADLSHLSLTDF